MQLKQADILRALAQRLQNDAGLLAIVGTADGVKNHLPQDAPLPYVRFRLSDSDAWDCKTSRGGISGTIVCDCWTREHGDLEALELADACIAALAFQPLTLPTGQQMLICRHERTSITIETDGQTHHAAVSFNHLSYEG